MENLKDNKKYYVQTKCGDYGLCENGELEKKYERWEIWGFRGISIF